jgi:uncharacterized membrane protein
LTAPNFPGDLSSVEDIAGLVSTSTAPPQLSPAGLPLSQAAKRHNETVPSAPGAKPSGKSVAPSIFHPLVSSADNPADPYIVAEAKALNNDPNQIFAFVRDQIGFEVYRGSLRGARGTLWSKAGNALDRASLYVALLGASGISARYVEGTIPIALEQQLILSMFPSVSQVTGCPPPGAQRSDPANDPTLLSEVSDHFWVEFGPSFTPADPSFPTDQIGRVPGIAANRFTIIPAALQHTVTFRLDIEEYQQASALFGVGDGIFTTEVLNQTFATTDLVGSPITAGNFVSGGGGGFILSATTFTYSPYLRVQVDPSDPTQDTIIQGQQYQEVYTNFPLGTQVLTGVFLYMDVQDPGATLQTYGRPFLDRIGYAARQTGNATVNLPAGTNPALTDFDLFAVDVNTSALDGSLFSDYQNALAVLQPELADATNGPAPDAQAVVINRDLSTASLRMISTSFSETSRSLVNSGAQIYSVRAYAGSPRLIIASSQIHIAGDTGQSSSGSLRLDLREDAIDAVAAPGQTTRAAFLFRLYRGFFENALESNAFDDSASPSEGVASPISSASVFQAAQAQGIGTITLTSGGIGELDSLPITANAHARISIALQQGKVVVTPASMVMVGSASTIAWYEIDPSSGESIGVTEDGGHQSIVDFSATIWLTFLTLGVSYIVIKNYLCRPVYVAQDFTCQNPESGDLGGVSQCRAKALINYLSCLASLFPPSNVKTLAHAIAPLDSTSLIPAPPFAVRLTDTLPAPGAGLSVNVVPDPTYGLAFQGSLLPLVNRAQIGNGGSSTGTFSLSFPSPPAGFSIEPALPSVTVGAAAMGEAGFCVYPTGVLPPSGSTANLSVNVSSATNPATTETGSATITIPAVQALILSSPQGVSQSSTSAPTVASILPISDSSVFPTIRDVSLPSAGSQGTSVSTQPGVAVPVTLTLQGVGNTVSIATLSVSSTPGLSVGGLSSPVTLAPGQSILQILTLTPRAGVAPGSPLSATVTATYGAPITQTAGVTFTVDVTTTQALAAATGSQDAMELGRSDIAGTLSGLSGAINSVVSSCSTTSQQLVLDYVNNLTAEMNAPFLANFTSSLSSASSAIAGSTCANITTALNNLSNVLSGLNTALSSPAAYPFDFQLLPNSATAQPNSTSTFGVFLRNTSSVTNTYTLSLGSLPAGVTGSLTQTSLTLAPGESTVAPRQPQSSVNLLITPTTGAAVTFNVTVAVNGVSNSARTIPGTLTARSQFLQVQDVTATPGFTNSGGSVDVVTHIANVVNESQAVQVQLLVQKNGINYAAVTKNVTLSVEALITTVDFGMVSTQGLANGNYTLSVTVTGPNGNPQLPGGTGSGTLLVGSPVAATLTATPQTLAPGNGTVTNTLSVSQINGASGLTLVGSVSGTGGSSLAFDSNYAYVCGGGGIGIVDVSNPRQPNLLSTFGAGDANSIGGFLCQEFNGSNGADLGFVGNNGIVTYDLSSPTAPVHLGSAGYSFNFLTFLDDYLMTGGNGYFTTHSFSYGSSIKSQDGEVFDYSFANPASPSVLNVLTGSSDAAAHTGPHFGITQVDATTLYFGSTTASGANAQTGQARVSIVDISNPLSLQAVGEVLIPQGVWATDFAIVGNTAVVAGRTVGWTDTPTGNPPDFYSAGGNLMIATLDITNHRSPTILSAIDTGIPTTFIPARTLVSMGGNLFAMALQPGDGQTTQPQIVLIDISNPMQIGVTTGASVPGLQSLAFQNGYLYATTSSGLNIYTAINGTALDYTASVQLPNSGKAIYNPESFSVAPVITHGTSFDTAAWTDPGTNTITWTSKVTGIQPADVLPVALGGTVDFNVSIGSGSIPLPQVDVNSGQVIGLNPASQTAAPGQLTAYTLTLTNPTAAPVTYSLSIAGVSSSWVTLPLTATVGANSSSNVTLNLRSALADLAGTYSFIVTATSATGSGSVEGSLVLQGVGTIGGQSSVVVALTPAQATAGQGTTANYVVQMTNAGAATDTYNLSVALPPGVAGSFDNSSVQVLPGVDSFVQTGLHLTVAPGTAPTTLAFTVTATSSTTPSVSGQASGKLSVVSGGITLSLNPNATAPNGKLPLTVKNTGTISDTFTLSLAGPAALVATLPATSVTLAAGASQTLNIAIGNPTFATLGNLALQVIGTSKSNSAITALVNGTVTVPSSLGVTASFQPASQSAASSGSAVFPLVVQNTGTIEDGYSAVISGTTGRVQASLVGLDGNPTQSIAQFRLPGVTTGQLFLNLTLTGSANGTATVKITSLTNSSISATATATVTPALPIEAPVANPGPTANIPIHHNAVLDGTGSYDPNSPALPLTYAWTLTSVPAGSSITNSSIRSFPSYPRAAFTPDVPGSYSFTLTVSNGQKTSTASVTLVASHFPPVAAAGKPQNAKTGAWVLLNGKNSYDPEDAPLTFAWFVDSVPQGSLITSAKLYNSSTPMPFFQPDVAGTYKLHLTVNDGVASSTPDAVTVTVTSENVPPNANAGYPQTTEIGHQVTLNGSLSNDPDSGPSPLTYSWAVTQVPAGSTIASSSLTGATSATPSFVPDVAGSYLLTLNVSDGASTSSDTVTIEAYKGFSPPDAVTAEQVDAVPKTIATFDGSGSLDPDNGPATLTYAWSIVGAPPASAAAIASGKSSSLQFTPDVPGYYTFQLEVSDGVETSDRNVLLLAAKPCDADGNGVVNQTDLDLIQAALGMPALPEDPRDPNHSGTVTLADYNSCKADLTQYQLTINTAGTGSGTVQPPSGLEPVGTPITLTATPGQCSTFAGFSSNVVNNQITLTGPATVTATFNNATAQQVGLLPVGGSASGQVIASAVLNRRVTNTNNWLRSYSLQNAGDALGNVYLVLDPPLTNVTALVSSTGTTICTTPEGSWYISIPDLPANTTQTVTIEVTTETPTSAWSAGVRILAGGKP